MQALDGGRIAMASQAVGIAQGAMDRTVDYLKEREQFGRPLSSFQGLQWMLADMETKINASRLLVQKAAVKFDNGENVNKDAAMAKLFASGNSYGCYHKSSSVTWWLWIYEGLSIRENDERCQDYRNI